MPITFVGYRGSGKSAVGAAVADRLAWQFVDADVEIERRAGRTIREIFAADGEPHFRELERELLAELLAKPKLVIAAGGGAVLCESTRTLLKQIGFVVYLRVSAEVAERRIESDATTADRRPALTTLPRRAEIETLMAARRPLYEECATLTLDVDRVSIPELAEAVTRSLVAEHHGGVAS